jgi:hypothetical protein
MLTFATLGLAFGYAAYPRLDHPHRASYPGPVPCWRTEGLCAPLPGALAPLLHVQGPARQTGYVERLLT